MRVARKRRRPCFATRCGWCAAFSRCVTALDCLKDCARGQLRKRRIGMAGRAMRSEGREENGSAVLWASLVIHKTVTWRVTATRVVVADGGTNRLLVAFTAATVITVSPRNRHVRRITVPASTVTWARISPVISRLTHRAWNNPGPRNLFSRHPIYACPVCRSPPVLPNRIGQII